MEPIEQLSAGPGGYGPPPGGYGPPPGAGGYGPPPGGHGPPPPQGFGQPPPGFGPPGGSGGFGPPGNYGPNQSQPTLAIVSLVCGILGMPLSVCCCGALGIPLAVTAIVCGILALSRASADPRGIHGRGFAIAGIICAVCALGLSGTLFAIGHDPSAYRQKYIGH